MSSRDRIVFFSGGTALRALSQTLAKHKLNSAHIITTFDSGGSSAALRKAFAMPAVGDLRNRLLALADRNNVPQSVYDIFGMRLDAEIEPLEAKIFLVSLARADAGVWLDMPEDSAGIIRKYLRFVLDRMPAAFSGAGASLGNLMLAGAYLAHNRDFGPALGIFSRLLHVRGIVLPVANENLHLGAVLENGDAIIGQHHFKKLPASIKRVFLTVHEPNGSAISLAKLDTGPCKPILHPLAASYLKSAAAIVFPMGSFYSSIMATLLPAGTGRAVASSRAIKIFVPNSGPDPESRDLSLADQAAAILGQLRGDAPLAENGMLLRYMLVDKRHGLYPGGVGEEIERQLAELGICLVDRPLVYANDPQKHDPEALLAALTEICASDRRGGC